MEDTLFRELYERARLGDETSINELIKLFNNVLIKYSIIDGKIDEDCMQELTLRLIKCIKSFELNENQEVYEYLYKKVQGFKYNDLLKEGY